MQSERISTESIISELFSNTENSKIFKKIPLRVIGATNVYLIKLNYNYSNQNKFSYILALSQKVNLDRAQYLIFHF